MSGSGNQHRLVVGLEGGLGNQLFQFANAFSLCADLGYRLVLDTRVGFWLDRQYRRSFLLNQLTDEFDYATWYETGLVLAGRLKRHISADRHLHSFIGHTLYIQETQETFLPRARVPTESSTTVIQGYWQAPKYFEHHGQTLRSMLRPPKPRSTTALSLGARIQSQESAAVGIRLYEESRDPEFHARDRRVKTASDYSRALAQMMDYRPLDHIYVFATHHFPFIDEVKWPRPKTVISHDIGISDPLQRLWLMTQARNFVFNNSSFYWWGAWLASSEVSNSPMVIAADNFRNTDAYAEGWLTF